MANIGLSIQKLGSSPLIWFWLPAVDFGQLSILCKKKNESKISTFFRYIHYLILSSRPPCEIPKGWQYLFCFTDEETGSGSKAGKQMVGSTVGSMSVSYQENGDYTHFVVMKIICDFINKDSELLVSSLFLLCLPPCYSVNYY